jgi:hypothetical protein
MTMVLAGTSFVMAHSCNLAGVQPLGRIVQWPMNQD